MFGDSKFQSCGPFHGKQHSITEIFASLLARCARGATMQIFSIYRTCVYVVVSHSASERSSVCSGRIVLGGLLLKTFDNSQGDAGRIACLRSGYHWIMHDAGLILRVSDGEYNVACMFYSVRPTYNITSKTPVRWTGQCLGLGPRV